jgi:glycyl-tRNA synthetase
MPTPSLESVTNLVARRGLYFQSALIYNGANGLYDMGPLGLEMVSRIKRLWWRRFVYGRDDMLGLDAAILTPEAVLKASGHVDSFTDPLIECEHCHIRLRADHYLEEEEAQAFVARYREQAMLYRKCGEAKATALAGEAWSTFTAQHILICPSCGKTEFTEPRQFLMMFATQLGAVEGAGSRAYLRPETAQGIFVNVKNILDTYHRKLPLGIAQIGKAFRNEITTGNNIFRVRELEQMEIEYFVRPGEDDAAFEQWLADMKTYLVDDLGLPDEMLRQYEHPREKLSHYSKRTVDYEFAYPFGWGELTGLANRTDYDLKQHQEHSSKDLGIFDEETRTAVLPYVVEPTFGVGRLLLALLCAAHTEYPEGREGKGEPETVLHLSPRVAPVAVAVLPLMKKDGLAEKAKEVHSFLRSRIPDRLITLDTTGAIGKRYRKHDEIGTPYCVTIDYDSLANGTVTVRDRDTMEQKRVSLEALVADILPQLI